MVKLFSINVFYKGVKPIQKKAAYELTSFGFFQRSGVREFMAFTSEVLVERTAVGQRQTVKEQDYRCHVYVRSDKLSCVVVADQDYPARVCFTLMNKVLEIFTADFPMSSWEQPASDLSYPPLDSFLKKYQYKQLFIQLFVLHAMRKLESGYWEQACTDPKEADPIMKVQNDLDETKIVLHDTIEHLLARGEKLDDLVLKTDKLSGTSKAFYKEAKGTTCCVIL